LVAVQDEQVNRRGPAGRDLFGLALMYFDPIGQPGFAYVFVEMLPRRSRAECRDDRMVMWHRIGISRSVERVHAMHSTGSSQFSRTRKKYCARAEKRSYLDNHGIAVKRIGYLRQCFSLLVAGPTRDGFR